LTQNDFNKILLSAVDEGLCFLGKSSEEAILYHLQTSFQLEKENIPLNLTEFQKALEGIFGPGATYLEEIIVKRLFEKLGLNFENGGNTDFLQCVHIAQSSTMPNSDTRRSQNSQRALGVPQVLFEASDLAAGSDKSAYLGKTQSFISPTETKNKGARR
jgi:hypothetical protein